MASASPAASLGNTRASVDAARDAAPLVPPPPPFVSSASLTRKTSTCLATSAASCPRRTSTGLVPGPGGELCELCELCLLFPPRAPREKDRVRPPGASAIALGVAVFALGGIALGGLARSVSSPIAVSSVSNRSTSNSSSLPVSSAASESAPNSRPASANSVGSALAASMARRFSASSAAAFSKRMSVDAVSLDGVVSERESTCPYVFAPFEFEASDELRRGTRDKSASKPRCVRSVAQIAKVTSGSVSAAASASISETIVSVASPSRPWSLYVTTIGGHAA